ncbi:MAG TPA: serine hydrolase [Candidatus Sulfotelmatobacter sp.]|jgi:CubicO group peptidase (beta-lactamase class C family)|nr:serine hydrolase [Candidatus Sulfotelmatobacter sp.]
MQVFCWKYFTVAPVMAILINPSVAQTSGPTTAQTPQQMPAPSVAPPADLDSYVASSMKTFDVPGMAVAIVKDGRIVVAKGYGVRKLGEPTPVDEFTLFGIGSNTKAFTTAALATLVDEGKLSWDDLVYQRLPGFVMYDPYVSHEMTIRDLLTHRSGMGLGEGDLLFWPHSTYTREEIIYKLRFMKPATSFRSKYAYDNLLYMTAGQIIPAVTGTSWDDYVRQRIFAPLGMSHSNLSNAGIKPGDNVAFPHSSLPGKLQVIHFEVLDNGGPAGAINSCAADMAKWVQLQLNRGKFTDRDGRLFTEQRSREMWTPQTILPTGDPPPPLAALKTNFADYALGWGLRDYHGRKLVGHTGGVAGFVSRVMLVPEENLGVVVLTNAEEGGAFDAILYHVLDHYFHLPPTDWISAYKAVKDTEGKDAAEAMKKAEGTRAADSKPSLPLEKYAGSYKDAWYGSITIRMESGGLVITFDHTPAMIGDLQHWQHDTFKAHWRDRTIEDAFVTFSLNPDGIIESARMAAVSPLADFSFDYQDLLLKPAEKK